MLRSEKSSTLTIRLTSPLIPCIVSKTGSQPDMTQPATPALSVLVVLGGLWTGWLSSRGFRSM